MADRPASPMIQKSSELTPPPSPLVEDKPPKRDRSAVLGGWSSNQRKSLSSNLTGPFSPETVVTEDVSKYDAIYKIIVIGDTATGKTSLLSRWLNDRFDGNNSATVGTEFNAKTYNIDGKMVKIQLWDTAGQERYRAVTRQYYRGALGAIVVYDITRKDSFENVKRWLDDLKDYNPDVVNMQILLLGNKIDLENTRDVLTKDGMTYSKKEGLNFLETSAKDGQNVLRAFQIIMQDIHKIQQQRGGGRLEGGSIAGPTAVTSNRKVIDLATNAEAKSEGGCPC
jgi:Ras-related protein Rab-11A